MTEADRFNTGKPELSYMLDFPTAVRNLARVCSQGAKKYSRDNWKKGGKPDTEYLDSALRHIFAFKAGELFDADCGTQHLAHAVWNLLALQELNHANLPDMTVTQPELPFDEWPSMDDEAPEDWEDFLDEEEPYRLTWVEQVEKAHANDKYALRYKGSEAPIAHDGEPVYPTQFFPALKQEVMPHHGATEGWTEAAVETSPPSMVRLEGAANNGHMPYSRPNTLKPDMSPSSTDEWTAYFKRTQQAAAKAARKALTVVDL